MRLLFGILLLAVAAIAKKDYTDYKLVQIIPTREDQLRMIAEWEHNPDFDMWNHVRVVGQNVDALLSPEAFVKYTTILKEHNIPYVVTVNNIQEVVEKEEKSLRQSRMEGKVVNTYPSLNDLFAWLNLVQSSNPTLVSQYTIGQSGQGRDLRVLVIKVPSGVTQKKVWIDCGIHAREWISPATCVSLINKFINDYISGEPVATNLLQNFELHILPSINPDGYEYSRASDRYWRKNRKVNPGSTCVGVDVNRNYPFQWLTGGSSTDPCSDTHAGPSAGSEPETKAVIANFLVHTFSAAYAVHSYGNWFLTSYGHTTQLPPDYAAQKADGDAFAATVRGVYGEIFTVGSTANLLYIASGAASDWFYGAKGIIHAATIELRPRNGVGVLGFNIAETQIPLVGNEIYAGIKTLLGRV